MLDSKHGLVTDAKSFGIIIIGSILDDQIYFSISVIDYRQFHQMLEVKLSVGR